MTQKLVAPIIALIIIVCSNINLPWFAATDNFIYDAFFRVRGACEMPDDVFFVYLDEQDIQSLGGWPLSRDYWAYAIHGATNSGARAIAIDVLFSTENQLYQEFDQSLVDIATSSKNLILPLVVNFSPEKEGLIVGEVIRPFDALQGAVAASGFANLGNEPTVRHVPVSAGNDSLHFYSFGVELARALAKEPAVAFEKLLPGSAKIRLNFGGYNFTGKGMSFVQFLQALRTDPASLELADKLVLIAPVAPGLPIVRKTPFAAAVPAALIHLNVAENILRQNYLQDLPGILQMAIVALMCFGAFLLALPALRKWWFFAVPMLLIGYLFLAFVLFASAFRIMPLSYPILGFLLVFLADFVVREKQIRDELLDRESILHAEVQRTQQQMAIAESTLFELRKQQLIEREKSTTKSQETEEKLLAQQQQVSALEKQLRDLQAVDEAPATAPSMPISSIIHADDSPLAAVVALVQRVADDDIPVLIEGETGTGKEIIARAVHDCSGRKKRPFVAVNCGALPESLLESELFGHEKGAFTGAQHQRRGRFELADSGSIFLDEITETSPAFQARLLRVLQEGAIERLGSERAIKIDVRCIAASNQNIKASVDDGRFRADLFYRLNGFPLAIPALRERTMDIPLLAQHFLGKHNFAHLKISRAVLENLCRYAWPGNVRELENAIRRMALLAKSEGKKIIRLDHLPDEIRQQHFPADTDLAFQTLEEQVLHALRQFKFSRSAISQTARLLGNKDRGTITEYFRGLCFQFLQDNDFDFAATAADLAATSEAEIVARVKKKLHSYLHNLDSAQKDPEHPQYKGLPKKYHPALDAVLNYLAAHPGR